MFKIDHYIFLNWLASNRARLHSLCLRFRYWVQNQITLLTSFDHSLILRSLAMVNNSEWQEVFFFFCFSLCFFRRWFNFLNEKYDQKILEYILDYSSRKYFLISLVRNLATWWDRFSLRVFILLSLSVRLYQIKYCASNMRPVRINYLDIIRTRSPKTKFNVCHSYRSSRETKQILF